MTIINDEIIIVAGQTLRNIKRTFKEVHLNIGKVKKAVALLIMTVKLKNSQIGLYNSPEMIVAKRQNNATMIGKFSSPEMNSYKKKTILFSAQQIARFC